MSESDGEKDPISQIIKYFPIFGIIALIYGIIYQYVYYQVFNINILEYTELNELLLDSVNHLIIIILPVVLLTATAILIITKRLDEKYENLKIEEITKEDRIPIIKKKNKMNLVLALGSSIWAVCEVLDFWFYHKFDILQIYCGITLLSFALLSNLYFSYFPYLYKQVFNKEISSSVYILVLSSMLLIGISIYNGLSKAKNTKNHSTNGVYIINDKDTLKSTNDYYFIGKTKGFVFFFNNTTLTTDAFAIKDIKILHLR